MALVITDAEVSAIKLDIEYLRTVGNTERPTMKAIGRDGHIDAVDWAMNRIEKILVDAKERENLCDGEEG